MDADHVDRLARALPSGTRRGAVRLLTIMPLAGVLGSVLGSGEQANAGNAGGGDRRRRQRHRRRNQDRGATGPDCTCPPDRRWAAVESCWETAGAPVRGDCTCAWIDGGSDADLYPCDGRCVCMRTVEGTGFCGAAPPLSEPVACTSSEDCLPIPGLPARACIGQIDHESFCWFACNEGR